MTPKATSEGNKRVALQFLAAATAYRIEEAMSLLQSDATWTVLGDPALLQVAGTKNGPDIARLLRGFSRLVPEPMQMTIHGTTAESERVAVEASCLGILQSGARYRNNYHFIFEFRDGRIAAMREYMDTLHVFDVIQHRKPIPAPCRTPTS